MLIDRFIHPRNAPGYLGMDRNRFNTEVRSYLTEIPIGKQGIAFDRLELDERADEYIKVQRKAGERRKTIARKRTPGLVKRPVRKGGQIVGYV